MIFEKTPLEGAYIIKLKKFEDDRGFFARGYCQKEFDDHGLSTPMVQTNISGNPKKGTIRGMHYQHAPHREAKLVRCVRGSLFDVIVDMRPESATFKQWFGAELSSTNDTMMYVPEGFAHGYLTLEDDTEAMYQVSAFYAPGVEGGLKYDDPSIGIKWPAEIAVISEKDAEWPLLK